MNNDFNITNNSGSTDCRNAQSRIAAYVGNDLSAREAWELERHLTDCSDCTQQTDEMRMTVSLLGSMERRDTSNDFMAKIHAKLDHIEPQPLRLRDRLAGLVAAVRDMRLGVAAPAFGLGAALVLITFMPHKAPEDAAAPKTAVIAPQTAPAVATDALHRNVALSANSLFDDPAAANLEAHAPADEQSEANDSPSL